ncbi:MAG: TonB-dependent receptor plug domain-containing protein, partial [Xanthomonas sp.]
MFQTSLHRQAPVLGVRARALLAALAVATSANAQDTAVDDGPRDARPAADATQLDTVMVKGQRLSLDLQQDAAVGALGTSRLLDTPFSVTLVEAPEIARRQATTLGQIFINDPSVFAAEPPATTNWWGTQIRGIGVRNFYVDGVPMLMEWGGEFPLEAVQSVQALKGLGGFMYGFGAPGGIVSYQTKRPTDTPLLATTIGYHNDSAFSAQVDAGGRVNGPDTFGYRLTAGIERGDAYNGAGIDRKTIALAIEQPIVEGLTWQAELVHERNTLEHEPLYFYWDGYEGDRLPTP